MYFGYDYDASFGGTVNLQPWYDLEKKVVADGLARISELWKCNPLNQYSSLLFLQANIHYTEFLLNYFYIPQFYFCVCSVLCIQFHIRIWY